MGRHLLVLTYLLLLSPNLGTAAETVALAKEGRALQPVIVAEQASERVRQAAESLAEYLSRIARARFDVTIGDGSRGLAVGTAKDFPQLAFAARFTPGELERREEYALRSHAAGVWLVGATELAVEHAVWDFLYRLGYRQFFPGEVWEVVPTVTELSVTVDDFQSPDYLTRRIWYGYGLWDYNAEPYARWCARNRCVAGVQLNTGHAYDGVVKVMRDEFERHPEYWPLLDGERKPVSNPKPCLGNPAVRDLFVRYAQARLADDPALDSLSMDPSDGGGWCECKRCARLGSVSDQAVTLANEVAAAIQPTAGDMASERRVGMYAYNYHSPPPDIRVHPQVVISVATAFIKGGLTLDEILEGWSRQGATLGIREYYGVHVWDRDQPAAAHGSDLEYLRRTIPEFHSRGARFMSAESSDNWGPNGLGYYLAARMLWDVDEAAQTEELVEDFLMRAFGAAREPMRDFYQQLDGSRPHLVVDDQLGRMFRALAAARERAQNADVLARINQLALYAHYCSLYRQYSQAEGAERQTAFESLIRHAYRMRQTMLIHAKALYRDLVRRDRSVSIPAGAAWNVPEADNPWKSSEPFAEDEIARLIVAGIARHDVVTLDFEPVVYSSDLIPASDRLERTLDDSSSRPAGQFGPGRGRQTFLTFVTSAPSEIALQITGGLIPHYRDRGHVRVALWKLGGTSESGERETRVATDRSVPPDGIARRVAFSVKEPGLYRLTVDDGNDRTRVTWPADQPMTVWSSLERPMTSSYSNWTATFFVPQGTRTLGFYGGERGDILDSRGQVRFSLNGRERNFYSLAVPEGEAGQFWTVRDARGDIRLLTVPPCFALAPAALLLPAP